MSVDYSVKSGKSYHLWKLVLCSDDRPHEDFALYIHFHSLVWLIDKNYEELEQAVLYDQRLLEQKIRNEFRESNLSYEAPNHELASTPGCKSFLVLG